MKKLIIGTGLMAVLLAVVPAFVQGQQPDTQARVAEFKQALAKNKADLKKYQWIETTTVSLKGEVKSVKKNLCYYGADGKIQKTPMDDPAPQAEQTSGRRGRLKQKVIAKKKEEMSDYMKEAVALVDKYVPPDPALVKYSKETNNVKVEMVEANRLVRVSLPDFIKKGDLMTATLDVDKNAIVDVNVSSFLESEKDSITLAVTFSSLADGTSYSSKTTLNAKAKEIVVVVDNSGYRPL